MEAIGNFFQTIYSVISTFEFTDLIDIAISSFIIYKLIQMLKETRAGTLIKGMLLLVLCYFVAYFVGFKTVTFALEKLFQIGLLAIIVLFQPELRRMLEKVGRTRMSEISMFSGDSTEHKAQIWEKSIDDISSAVSDLSATKTGALIVIECTTRLGEQIDTGVKMNAMISKELFGNIFIVNTPLHDGAVIIRDGVILAAACFLPKPQNETEIQNTLGSRHRAAIGMSEVSDAIIIVVSEETGIISVARDGLLTRGFTKESLSRYLTEKLIPEKQTNSIANRTGLNKLLHKFDKKGKQDGRKENEDQKQ